MAVSAVAHRVLIAQSGLRALLLANVTMGPGQSTARALSFLRPHSLMVAVGCRIDQSPSGIITMPGPAPPGGTSGASAIEKFATYRCSVPSASGATATLAGPSS